MPAVQAQLDKFEGVISAEVFLDTNTALVKVKKGVVPQDLADTVTAIGFKSEVKP